MNLEIIYDSSLSPAQVSESRLFNNAQFLIFDLPGSAQDEGIEVGFVLVIEVPALLSTLKKDVILPSFEFQGVLSSFSAIEIPREYSESGYDLKCAFNSSIAVSSFRVYAITSAITQESISQQVAELQADVDVIKTDLQTIKNSLSVIFKLVETLIGVSV